MKSKDPKTLQTQLNQLPPHRLSPTAYSLMFLPAIFSSSSFALLPLLTSLPAYQLFFPHSVLIFPQSFPFLTSLPAQQLNSLTSLSAAFPFLTSLSAHQLNSCLSLPYQLISSPATPALIALHASNHASLNCSSRFGCATTFFSFLLGHNQVFIQ